MSRKGECQDNACAETFFHSLKVEWIYGEPLKSRYQMKYEVREYIEVFYNRIRAHSTLGYRTRKKGKPSDRYIVRGRRRGKKKGR